MRYNKLLMIIFLLLLVPLVHADLFTMFISTNMTATRGVTDGGQAKGLFDSLTAVSGAYTSTNDVVTLNLSNYTGMTQATIVNVTFEIRMNISGTWGNDILALQYSNDSGTTWFTSNSSMQPGATIANYGNYSTYVSFRQFTTLNRSMVRLIYTRTGGADGVGSGVDGVQLYVWYAPPPTVTLTHPSTGSWSALANVSFNFTPASLIAFSNCSIYINGTLNQTNRTAIVNATNNTLNVTGFDDGDYSWNVTCLDASAFGGTAITSWLVRIDTKAPNVTLVTPLNDNISSAFSVNFTFNATDANNVTQCLLIIDDLQKNSTDPAFNVSKNMNISLFAALTNGDHPWYVNCTDEAGNVKQSQIFNISIQVTEPTIQTDKPTYIKGTYVNFTGINWDVGADITINITFSNGSSMYLNVTGNATGGINRTAWYINYTSPEGQYNVTAWQLADPTMNATTTFIVNNRTVNITPDLASYMQGDTVMLQGIGFHPSSHVNITINYTGGRNNTIITADDEGNFTFNYELNLSAVIGRYNVTAFDLNFSILNASTFFIVTNRTPRIITNKTLYVANESALINGSAFSNYGTVLIQIFNTLTQKIGNGFPTYLFSNSMGRWNYTWFVNNTCSGNYTVLGEDQNITAVRANATFLIWNRFNSSLQQVATSVVGNRVSASVANVNVSENTVQPTGLSGTVLDGYLEFNFLNTLPTNATFIRVNITIEHSRTSSKVTNYQMYWVNASGLTILTDPGCSGTPPDADDITTCNLTTHVRNATIANNITIRVNYTRTGGGASDAETDFAVMNYGWNGDLYGCKEFGDDPVIPVVSNVIASPSVVVLNAGTTKIVECNFTVTDGNGAADIIGVNVTMYTTPSVSTDVVTNLSKYDNSSCALVATGTNTKDFTCIVPLLYYANNGTWTCNATGISTDGIGSGTMIFGVDPLYAITVNDTFLDFGQLATGAISNNVTENITNVGNQPINVSVRGYGRVMDDNNSFTCITSNITIGNMRFASNISATYDEKETLANLSKQLRFTMQTQTNPATLRTNSTYWQVQIPTVFSDTGQCNGTIIFDTIAG